MKKDCNLPLTKLRVDGRMTANNLLMQLQADLCGIPVGKIQYMKKKKMSIIYHGFTLKRH